MRSLGIRGLVVLEIAALSFTGIAYAGVPAQVPEMGGASAVSAIVLALGSLVLLRDRWRRK